MKYNKQNIERSITTYLFDEKLIPNSYIKDALHHKNGLNIFSTTFFDARDVSRHAQLQFFMNSKGIYEVTPQFSEKDLMFIQKTLGLPVHLHTTFNTEALVISDNLDSDMYTIAKNLGYTIAN